MGYRARNESLRSRGFILPFDPLFHVPAGCLEDTETIMNRAALYLIVFVCYLSVEYINISYPNHLIFGRLFQEVHNGLLSLGCCCS